MRFDWVIGGVKRRAFWFVGVQMGRNDVLVTY